MKIEEKRQEEDRKRQEDFSFRLFIFVYLLKSNVLLSLIKT